MIRFTIPFFLMALISVIFFIALTCGLLGLVQIAVALAEIAKVVFYTLIPVFIFSTIGLNRRFEVDE